MNNDDDSSPARRNFNLRAFRELTQEDLPEKSELLANPVNVAVIKDNHHSKDRHLHHSLDDGVIKRIYKSPFPDNQSSTKTLPRRHPYEENNERYFYPSNTIVASNGHVYHVEPFMLPPPQQISQVIRDLTDRTEFTLKSKSIDNRSSKNSSSSSRRVGESMFFSSDTNLRPPSSSSSSSSITNRPSSSRSLDGGGFRSSYFRPTQSSQDVFHMVEDEDGLIDDDEEDKDKNEKVRRIPGERRASDSQLYTNKRLFKPDALNNKVPFSPRPLQLNQSATEKKNSTTTTSTSTSIGHEDEFKGFSIVRYMASEILGMVESNNYDSDAVVKIQNFLGVPFMVERLIFLGLFACLDSFLYVMTYLPIRVIIACSTILWNVITLLPIPFTTKSGNAATSGIMRTQQYDLIRGLLFLIGCYALRLLNMRRVYHYIRGQTMIKLYVLTSILEVFDRLLGSFGQDAFESLHLQTKNHPFQWNNIVTFLVVSVYVIIHSIIYFIYVATLLVAINSAESALITVINNIIYIYMYMLLQSIIYHNNYYYF